MEIVILCIFANAIIAIVSTAFIGFKVLYEIESKKYDSATYKMIYLVWIAFYLAVCAAVFCFDGFI